MGRIILLRLAALALCLLTSATSAAAEGLRFSLRAEVDPGLFPADTQPVMEGVSTLLGMSRVEGTLITGDRGFSLNAALIMGSDGKVSQTGIEVFGLPSHWGVRSTLLGNQELMVNVGALLEFGQKASGWLGLPLDKAALLVPYTHEFALESALDVLSPLFPEQPGAYDIPRADLNDMARSLLALCDEDAALSRWLDVTGLYPTVVKCIERFLDLPELLVPGLRVTRTANSLRWDVSFLNILTWTQEDTAATLRVSVPTMLSVKGEWQTEQSLLHGSLHAEIGDALLIDAACLLPSSLPTVSEELFLRIDAEAPFLPESGLHLAVEGSIQDDLLLLRRKSPDQTGDMLTLIAQFSPSEPETVPAFSPEDLTGMNILSINGDSLRVLMNAVKQPLLTGLFDLLVAAPPETVQALMDALEDAGVIDLLADALMGESTEY